MPIVLSQAEVLPSGSKLDWSEVCLKITLSFRAAWTCQRNSDWKHKTSQYIKENTIVWAKERMCDPHRVEETRKQHIFPEETAYMFTFAGYKCFLLGSDIFPAWRRVLNLWGNVLLNCSSLVIITEGTEGQADWDGEDSDGRGERHQQTATQHSLHWGKHTMWLIWSNDLTERVTRMSQCVFTMWVGGVYF